MALARDDHACATTVVAEQGVPVAIHHFGGSGPVVLFAHATGMHGWVWKPVAEHLVELAECAAVDLRGHGNSPIPVDSGLRWTDFGIDVRAAASVFRGREIVGVGHSLGGAAMLMAELRQPGTFRRLVLFEPAVSGDPGEEGWGPLLQARDAMVKMTASRRARFDSRAEALANFVRKPPMALFQAAALDAYVNYGFADCPDSVDHSVVLKCLPETESHIYATSYDHDTAERLGEVACPVTLVTGSRSDDIQRQSVERLAARFAVTPVVLPGARHFGPLQQPEQFAELIARHGLDR